LGRAADSVGHAFWQGLIATLGRNGVSKAFATSMEFINNRLAPICYAALYVADAIAFAGKYIDQTTAPTNGLGWFFNSTTDQYELAKPITSCADAGSNDTYACSLAPAPTSYATGQQFWFKANTANTGAATINFNSLGAKTIVKLQGGITTTLADNDIRAGQWVELMYDGPNMQMLSELGNSASTSPGGSNHQVQLNANGVFGGIATGTSGQVLTSNGASADPTFQTAGGCTSTVALIPLNFGSGNGSTGIGSANLVKGMHFTLQCATTVNITSARVQNTGGATTAHLGWGIYSANGNTLLVDSGPVLTDSNAVKQVTLGSTVILPAGEYLFAWTLDSTVPTINSFGLDTTYQAFINQATNPKIWTAANASVAGQLPATLGTLTALSATANQIILAKIQQ